MSICRSVEVEVESEKTSKNDEATNRCASFLLAKFSHVTLSDTHSSSASSQSAHQHPQRRRGDRSEVPPDASAGPPPEGDIVFVVVAVAAPESPRRVPQEPDRRGQGREREGARQAASDVGDGQHGGREAASLSPSRARRESD